MTVETFAEGTWPGNEIPGQVVHTLVGDGLPDWVALLEPVARLAHGIASTDFVPSGVRGRPGAVAAAILYGHELGLGPMVSLAGIDIVDGRPQPSSEMMRSLILRRGHRLLVTEATGVKATVVGRRVDTGDSLTITWTLDMAEKAGLAGKDNWRKYPRAMLVARASADVARMLFPDVIGGLTLPDDADQVAVAQDGGDVAAQQALAPAQPATRTRTRRPAGAPADAPPAAADTADALPPPVGGTAGGAQEAGGRSETATTKTAGEDPDQAPPAEPPLPLEEPTIEEVAAAAAEMRARAAQPSGLAKGALMGVFRRRGFEDRAERLAVTSALVGRQVDSSADLTDEEVRLLLVRLPDVDVAVVRDGDGTVRAVIDEPQP